MAFYWSPARHHFQFPLLLLPLPLLLLQKKKKTTMNLLDNVESNKNALFADLLIVLDPYQSWGSGHLCILYEPNRDRK